MPLLNCFIGVHADCPMDSEHCIADWRSPCPHFGGVVITDGGFAVHCTHQADQYRVELENTLEELAGYVMDTTDTGAYYHRGDRILNEIGARINGIFKTPWGGAEL